ncbi:type III PLP-dependent enzyme [Acidocella sp.]|uniref:type III PLP-dependent enzyme n=1 Tax=Acidocella sp. TaxID=50710 RepID=UPI00262E97F1|nr:type III PLP-dependent enzyme [Acidocella sp.]
MSLIKNRAAVGPLHCHISLRANGKTLSSVDEMVKALRPEEPLHCVRPEVISNTAAAFRATFNGKVLYAVKCNPEPAVLRAVWDGGVRHFDCASISEVQLVRRLFPGAEIHFMHPVKARSAIREAWMLHGVRDFVLDTGSELTKIMQELEQQAGKPGLFIRLRLPEMGAAINLSQKFGAEPEAAISLLHAARSLTDKLGVAFHVGSQCLDPAAWRDAMQLAGEVIRASGVRVDVLDIGGGFPIAYPDMSPPPLGTFMAEIDAAYNVLQMPWLKLWAEPGRALVGSGASVVVQVQMRRGNMLYINDGVYGTLADAGTLRFRFPTRLLRTRHSRGAPDTAFGFFGPSCDSLDVMHGPFLLPDDVTEGDWIEIGQLGAYGTCLRTAFNGFDRGTLVEVSDGAMLETAGYELPKGRAPAVVKLPTRM